MRLELDTRDQKYSKSNFFILCALQYDNEFHYLYLLPPEISPATRFIGGFRVCHVQGDESHVVGRTVFVASYGVEFLPIASQAGSNSPYFSRIGEKSI